MKIIGLTGGIASGKNFVAEIFRQKGAAIFDADHEVHLLLALDKPTILEVKNNFPESFVNLEINRKILGKIVFADAAKLQILEKILHPKVRARYEKFLKDAKKSKKKLVVLNIPLLLETSSYPCDKVIALLSPPSIQKKRFLARAKKITAAEKKILEKKFEQIRLKQLSNSERKSQADFVVNTGGSKANTKKQVQKIIKTLTTSKLSQTVG